MSQYLTIHERRVLVVLLVVYCLGNLRIWQKEQLPGLLPGNLDSLDQAFAARGNQLVQSSLQAHKPVSFPLNLNTATVEELIQLPGIGPSRAGAILELRAETGSFSSIEELLSVRGIGAATIDKLSGLLVLETVTLDSMNQDLQIQGAPK